MYGCDILCGISKVPFEIPHKISYPYIERCDFYATLNFQELLDLRAQLPFWNATVEVEEWISNFIPHITRRVITYPCGD